MARLSPQEEIEFLKRENYHLAAQVTRLKEEARTHLEREQDLEDHTRLLRAVIDAATDGIIFSDESGYFFLFNPAMERLTGYTAAEANACHDFNQLIYPRPQECLDAMARLRQVIERGDSMSVETVIQPKNGPPRPVWVSTALITVGERRHFLSLFHDIGEQKKAETELRRHRNHLEELVNERTIELSQANVRLQKEMEERQRAESGRLESEGRFASLVESMEDFIFTLGPDLRFTGLFGRWAKKEGLAAIDMIGKTVGDVFGAQAGALAEGVSQSVLHGEAIIYEWHFERHGAPRYFQTSLSPLRALDGQVSGIVGVARDITLRRRTEATLIQSEARTRALIETMNDGLFILTPAHVLSYANQPLCDMLGYQKEEIVGHPFQILFCPEDQGALDLLKQECRPGRRCSAEVAFQRKDGRAISATLSLREIGDGEIGNGEVFGVVRASYPAPV